MYQNIEQSFDTFKHHLDDLIFNNRYLRSTNEQAYADIASSIEPLLRFSERLQLDVWNVKARAEITVNPNDAEFLALENRFKGIQRRITAGEFTVALLKGDMVAALNSTAQADNTSNSNNTAGSSSSISNGPTPSSSSSTSTYTTTNPPTHCASCSDPLSATDQLYKLPDYTCPPICSLCKPILWECGLCYEEFDATDAPGDTIPTPRHTATTNRTPKYNITALSLAHSALHSAAKKCTSHLTRFDVMIRQQTQTPPEGYHPPAVVRAYTELLRTGLLNIQEEGVRLAARFAYLPRLEPPGEFEAKQAVQTDKKIKRITEGSRDALARLDEVVSAIEDVEISADTDMKICVELWPCEACGATGTKPAWVSIGSKMVCNDCRLMDQSAQPLELNHFAQFVKGDETALPVITIADVL
ncbi:hypothetical protein H072_7431 [Dactylellina haptotyla CBS 200.50]|uniref:Uncharacterized protein n=1 Tax=Dactylellina haptotyla (strain CBS 200.50) TaxID=1284197 RepID=S8ACQ1_DACHA|nr:hypothetical protein H072_7431 [Dactylellina haptotyla CBS 200.50]